MAAPILPGQSSSTPDTQSAPAVSKPQNAKSAKAARKAEVHLKPFSAYALGGGISLMGVNMQAATNVNRYLNLRGSGNYFTYSVNNIKVSGNNGSNGVDVSGNLNFATGGVSLDYFPFPKNGFRLSPGVLFYNQNQISAGGVLSGGNSFTLNGDKYYSVTTDPLTMNANLGLNNRQQAFTMTTGWGNMIPRKNGNHISFPFEFGAAFTGVPTVNVGLLGSVCTNMTQTMCGSVTPGSGAIATMVNTDLNAQIAKWKSDLNPMQVYPIISFGIAYDFHTSK
jgi:hypothetical protein